MNGSQKTRLTVSAYARELILQGLSNKEVYEKLQKKFGKERINEDHVHYPCWYRGEMRRKGTLPKNLHVNPKDK